MPSRNNSSDGSYSPYGKEKQRRNRSNSPSGEKNVPYHNRYKKQEKNKPQIKMILMKQQSDIRNHLKFVNLKIKQKDQHQIIQLLDNKLTQYVGPLTHITKIKNGSYNKYQESLSLLVGFKYDLDALSYLQGRAGQLQIRYHKQMIKFKPIPTQIFQLMIPKLKQLNWKQTQHPKFTKYFNRQNNFKQSRQNKRQYSSSQERSRNKHSKNYNRLSSSRSDSSSKSHYRKILYLFGLPVFTRDKKIQEILRDMKQGQFIPQTYKWKKIQDSTSQYLQISLDPKKAQKLISLRDKLRIDGFPVVIIQGGLTSTSSIKRQLKEFQFIIQFPQKVHPINVYKGISECGKIVQMIAQQHIVDGLCSIYSVTMSSSYIANEIRKLSKTSQGIIISELNQGQIVHRPSHNSSIHPSQKKERFQK